MRMTDTNPGDQVILATGGYDHTIRFWAAYNGQCQRIVQHPDSVSQLRVIIKLMIHQYTVFVAEKFNDGNNLSIVVYYSKSTPWTSALIGPC